MSEGSNERKLVHHFSDALERIADLQSGHFGGYGAELAANLRRCIGLQIKSINRAQTALQKNVDEGDIFLGRRCSDWSGAEQSLQREVHAKCARRADAQEIPSRQSVAESSLSIHLVFLTLVQRFTFSD